MLADLPTNERSAIAALGFINNGRELLSSSYGGLLRAWDIGDIADQVKRRHEDDWKIEQFKTQNWVKFQDESNKIYNTPEWDRLKLLIEGSGGTDKALIAERPMMPMAGGNGLCRERTARRRG